MTTRLVEAMRERMAPLAPSHIDIRDDSHRHAGHGASGGHFTMTVVSAGFAGKRRMERHRMVYDALGDLMKTDIHALSIDAKTPDET
jgi:BolA protein